ncbi:MAG: hypothetical protein GY922_01650 [Proteobacteria bacterium]|nr:hypothetical protein [Pseudomonadota bacterium]
MIDRSVQVYAGDEMISETFRDVEWDEVREWRNLILKESDWRFMSDQSPSDEWIAYRVFLRDLPQNYDEANDAADAWNQYEIPE